MSDIALEEFAHGLESEFGDAALRTFCVNIWQGDCEAFQPELPLGANRVACKAAKHRGKSRFCVKCYNRNRRVNRTRSIQVIYSEVLDP